MEKGPFYTVLFKVYFEKSSISSSACLRGTFEKGPFYPVLFKVYFGSPFYPVLFKVNFGKSSILSSGDLPPYGGALFIEGRT